MSNPTIVCVDDDREVLLNLRIQLTNSFPDYAIAIAESEEQALALTAELLIKKWKSLW